MQLVSTLHSVMVVVCPLPIPCSDDIHALMTPCDGRLHQEKTGLTGPDQAEEVARMVKAYVEGLCWVMAYYYDGVASWTWCLLGFPHSICSRKCACHRILSAPAECDPVRGPAAVWVQPVQCLHTVLRGYSDQ